MINDTKSNQDSIDFTGICRTMRDIKYYFGIFGYAIVALMVLVSYMVETNE